MTQTLYDEARAMERTRFGLQVRGGAAARAAQVASARRSKRLLDTNDEQLPMQPPRRRRPGLEMVCGTSRQARALCDSRRLTAL